MNVQSSKFKVRGSRFAAFTLIEIMIVVGIIAIIMAISIPSIYQQVHQDSIRKAVQDVTEACFEARSQAIMSGHTAELSIKLNAPRTITVTLTGQTSEGYVGGDDGGGTSSGGGGTVFSRRFSDHLTGIEAETFKAADRELDNEMICKFYANGTCDPMRVLLRADTGEGRIITTDAITGVADVEVMK
jgi:prepilin-type N-terminal cleavage/methylation domain-containing protein